jgi:uncharacterized membrane protein
MEKKERHCFDIIAYILTFCFILAGIAVSLNRFWQYDAFYYDFGIFDEAIWKVSQLKAPIIEHMLVGGKWIFADHFSPSIFLVSPFYWLTSRSEIILVVQAITVGLSGLVLYSIGKKVLNNKFLALAVLFCYYLFSGLQNAIIFDFHELTVATLPMMFIFWAILNRKLKLYFLFLIITLGFKESLFTAGIGIGIALFFLRKEWRHIAFITIIVSIIWGIISTKFIIPAFSGMAYAYAPTLSSGVLNKVTAMFDSPLKTHTLFYSFLSFGFLPILSPTFWPLIIQDYALRFLPEGFNVRWDLGLHYNAQSAVILAVGGIFGLRNLMKIRKSSKFMPFLGIALILNALFLYRFILRGPFALAYNPAFYAHTIDFVFLDALIKKIPVNASIMTQNNLAVRFTHQQVWILRSDYELYKPDYILIDNRKGQGANNFYATMGNVDAIIKSIMKDSNYVEVYGTKEQFIFKKVNNLK